nr:uncharacterized protein LOC127295386 isoform X2 [Lolium perenne]
MVVQKDLSMLIGYVASLRSARLCQWMRCHYTAAADGLVQHILTSFSFLLKYFTLTMDASIGLASKYAFSDYFMRRQASKMWTDGVVRSVIHYWLNGAVQKDDSQIFGDCLRHATNYLLRNLLQKQLLPGQGETMDMMPVADPDAIHASPTFIKKDLTIQLKDDLAAAHLFF